MAPNSVAVTMEKPDNFSLLEINGSDPSSFPDNKRKSISPKQFSWFILLKAHRVVSCLSWLFASVKKRIAFSSKNINEEEDPKSRGKQMYRFIKACLVISIIALSIEIVAYYKKWDLDLINRPSWEVHGLVEWSYMAWLSFRSDYIAPIVITLSKFCTVLFLIQSLDRLVLCLGCFYIKLKKIEPKLKDDALDLEDASDFPMVLIQIPMCNEREVYEQSIGAASQLDWPKDRILIQVLDDSDDPNLQLLIKEEVTAWAEKGATIPPQFPLEIRSALRWASSTVYFFRPIVTATPSFRHRTTVFRPRAFSSTVKLPTKPSLCTADELHYVSVPNSDWRLALWRYLPSPQAPTRNHPLLLLSGVGTNAIGYDLSPGCSFARHMSGEGFETWILEVRGAGLSTRVSDLKDVQDSAHELSQQIESTAKAAAKEASSAEKQATDIVGTAPAPDVSVVGEASAWDESQLVARLTATFMRLSERLSGFLSEGQSVFMSAKLFDKIAMLLQDSQLYERFNEIRSKLLSLIESRQNSGLGNQIRELTQGLVNLFDDGQKSVSPQLFDLHERLTTTIEDFQKQLDLIVKYDWDFDNYLEEDVPAAIEYVRAQSKPKDGKLFAIGHSMGGILLYAMLSRCAFEGREPGLAAVATLASSVDYTTSDSALKLLIPLADPAQALNVPVVPLGALLAAAFPLSTRPPYVLSWLNDLISAADMMHPEQLEKLVLNNFCTIPAKLLIQLTTAFREGGLRDRSGEFFYKDHLSSTSVPVLALAGDRDLICPPVAVEDTVKLFPENLVTYKLLGEPDGPHYAHYDLVGGRLAVEQVYPCITEFLSHHDSA